MGKKEFFKKHNSFWTFSGNFNLDKLLFGGKSLASNSTSSLRSLRKENFINNSFGFTLTELLVVIGILGILMGMTLIAINPVSQFQKANDAKRKSYINEIKTALEFYKIDQKYYPIASTSFACNASFGSGSTVYINKVPCAKSTDSYAYVPTASCDNSTIFCTQFDLSVCLEDPNATGENVAGDGTCTSGKAYKVSNP